MISIPVPVRGAAISSRKTATRSSSETATAIAGTARGARRCSCSSGSKGERPDGCERFRPTARSTREVALLEGFVSDPAFDRKHKDNGGPALGAIALHDDPRADAALERYVAPGNPERMRKQAAFWLGNARGRRGYEVLRSLAAKEESPEMRRHLTFALSQSDVPESIDTLIAMARHDASSSVRGQALFWLAQKAGKKAGPAIEDAIRDDPETDVKKKAVFALTQMPGDEGVPLLIGVARNNKNPAVRKQAIFWLGQSKDPRALDFIEKILTK